MMGSSAASARGSALLPVFQEGRYHLSEGMATMRNEHRPVGGS
jgi:hypothetical protein